MQSLKVTNYQLRTIKYELRTIKYELSTPSSTQGHRSDDCHFISSNSTSPVQTLDILHPSTSLEWEKWPPLPVSMNYACSVCLNGTVYLGGRTTIRRPEAVLYSFKPGVDSTWTVTATPTYYYTLVVHDSELLLVGGCEYPIGGEITNKVFTMRDGQFVEALPPMKERRRSSSAVSSGSALVVAGGWDGTTIGALSSVEVFKDGQWTTAPSLPSAGSSMKSALHGDQWYLITYLGPVFRTSLQSLISGGDQSLWETLPDAPNYSSGAAFFGGHLLSIGGRVYPNPTTTIHAFSPSTQSWEHVADLPVPLGRPTAVFLSSEQLIVSSGAIVLHGRLSGELINMYCMCNAMQCNQPFLPHLKYTRLSYTMLIHV